MDFSSHSRLALEMARSVAPDAEIILLHVLDHSLEGTLRSAGVKDEAALSAFAPPARALRPVLQNNTLR